MVLRRERRWCDSRSVSPFVLFASDGQCSVVIERLRLADVEKFRLRRRIIFASPEKRGVVFLPAGRKSEKSIRIIAGVEIE